MTIQSKTNILDTIILNNKKEREIWEHIKKGRFIKSITATEKRLFIKKISVQMNVFHKPIDKTIYDKELKNIINQIYQISGIGEISDRILVLQNASIINLFNFEKELKGLHDDRKEFELKLKEFEKERKNSPEIQKLKLKIENIKKKILQHPARKDFIKRDRIIKRELTRYQSDIKKFARFIDRVNIRFKLLGKSKGFNKFYLYDDLTFQLVKKEKHIIIIEEKEHIAPLKVYKFKNLDPYTKVKIINIIKSEFNKTYFRR